MAGQLIQGSTPTVGAKPDRLDLGEVGAELIFHGVGAWDEVHVQTVMLTHDGAFGTGVVTVERSNDGQSWEALSTPVTVTATGFLAAIDTTTFMHLRLRVSAAGDAGDVVAFRVKGYRAHA